jgi:predicted house-cleaning NTP pyrophosphatase (Maf/HAM1 superfamily)
MHNSKIWPCRLNGHTHQVCTGVALVKRTGGGGGGEGGEGGEMVTECFHELTNVTFAQLNNEVMESYIKSGEPL